MVLNCEMQLLLPLFPIDTKFISDIVGVYEQDGIVQYIVNGLPVFCHDKDDLQSFRFITSNMVERKLCTQAEVVRCFGVSEDSVSRSLKKFRNNKERAFFSQDNRHGHSHKLRDEVKEQIQKKLDRGQSVNSIANEHNVAEGTIRYAIRMGYLKKSLN